MKIEIDGDEVCLMSNIVDKRGRGKGVLIYFDKENNSFSLSLIQRGLIIGCLPRVTFYKNHTIIHNNLPQGNSIED